ncbi:MAG: hypothetical protein HQ581_22340 [Planctomycetes bacterium]|nr:hypothetical protein [Planctomycetota bacterium]
MQLEREMLPAVERWLATLGCQVIVCEALHLAGGPCDVIGARFEPRTGRAIPHATVYAVELKLSKIAEVIRQATRNRHVADYSYAAMPAAFCERMLSKSLAGFATSGVGLLAVGDRSVAVIVPAAEERLTGDIPAERVRAYQRTLWRRRTRYGHPATEHEAMR